MYNKAMANQHSGREEQMSKGFKICPLILPFIIGIILGIIAKLIDVPYITSRVPLFDDIMGRFGIWVWAAAIISILSKTALLAAVRSFVFFIGMLAAYYGYTVLFLNFFPKSQMILWGGIAMITPFCGFLIWQTHKERHYADFISSLPFTIFFTEWYLTAFAGQYWTFSTAKDELLLGIAYLCFTFSLLAFIPTNKKRLFSLLYGLLISIILVQLIQAEIIANPYELLNI
ncbi:MAG: hypothetical protein K2L86_11760 [Lachnospiraceae bacterium]|nr:hypothetical protein [Lachnospiraceae bacterium]